MNTQKKRSNNSCAGGKPVHNFVENCLQLGHQVFKFCRYTDGKVVVRRNTMYLSTSLLILTPNEGPLKIFQRSFDVLVGARTVAILGIFLADGAAASSADRCHSLASLHLPQAALGSLPLLILTPNEGPLKSFQRSFNVSAGKFN